MNGSSVQILVKNDKGFAICVYHKSIAILSGCFGDLIEELNKNFVMPVPGTFCS